MGHGGGGATGRRAVICGKLTSAFSRLAAAAILLAACLPGRSDAQQPGQKTFSSPQEASTALVAAAQSNDEKAILEILGPDGKQIISSGDEAEDAQSRADFLRRYQQMHRLVKEPDGFTLYVGAENWPLPIPVVERDHAWYFDTAAGKREILYRRIGRNEISAIRVCQELVAAQKEYYSAQHEFAKKILSDEGQHNGLYWQAAEGEPQSPIGPLVASAVAEGYAKPPEGAPTPYRGYYYRVLTRQAKNGPGGPKNYIVDGKMTGGFAFVAYPAEYRSSGVMTFIVNEDGVVYQKDLGWKTDVLAKAMKEYNPGSGWQKAEDQQWQSASSASGGRLRQLATMTRSFNERSNSFLRAAGSQRHRSDEHQHHPHAFDGRRAGGQLGTSRNTDGAGAGGLLPMAAVPSIRSSGSGLAEPRSFRAVDRPRIHAALLAPALDRRPGGQQGLRDARRTVRAVGCAESVPAAWIAAVLDTPSTAGRPESRPLQGRSARALPPASAWPSPGSGWPRATTVRDSKICSTSTSTRYAAMAA